MVLKSLSYFEDADKDSSPIIFDPLDWEEIKQNISNSTIEILNKYNC